ncbi:MAG TPA: hypothetical protein VHE35_20415 [Kofleriaceae bacterium]|nr:hypothetical protein [Kofleriaceae bacterium]
MGVLDSIKKLFKDPRLVTRFDDLEAGQLVVEGAVRLGDGEAMASPIKGQPCVAFFYTAAHQTPSRQASLQVRPLRHVEIFAPFELELDGGRIDAVPRVPGSFSREDHQKLAGAGYANFRATEEVVPPRTRVRVWGVARRHGDRWTLTYRRIEKLGAERKAGKPGKPAKRKR